MANIRCSALFLIIPHCAIGSLRFKNSGWLQAFPEGYMIYKKSVETFQHLLRGTPLEWSNAKTTFLHVSPGEYHPEAEGL